MKYSLSHIARQVKESDPDRFLAAMFIPEQKRETWFALLAFNTEIRRIPSLVSEEIIAHIRYAWLEEGVEGIAEGHVPRQHPVLQALALPIRSGELTMGALLELLEHYRNAYPLLPDSLAIDEFLTAILSKNVPDAEKPWKKAMGIIRKHRLRYPEGNNGWLTFKLLLAGTRV